MKLQVKSIYEAGAYSVTFKPIDTDLCAPIELSLRIERTKVQPFRVGQVVDIDLSPLGPEWSGNKPTDEKP